MGHHRVLVLPMGSPPRRTATSLSLSQFRLRMPWFPPFFLLVAHVSDPSFSPRPGLTQQGCAVRLCLSSQTLPRQSRDKSLPRHGVHGLLPLLKINTDMVYMQITSETNHSHGMIKKNTAMAYMACWQYLAQINIVIHT